MADTTNTKMLMIFQGDSLGNPPGQTHGSQPLAGVQRHVVLTRPFAVVGGGKEMMRSERKEERRGNLMRNLTFRSGDVLTSIADASTRHDRVDDNL